jgi:hypothetical protein
MRRNSFVVIALLLSGFILAPMISNVEAGFKWGDDWTIDNWQNDAYRLLPDRQEGMR